MFYHVHQSLPDSINIQFYNNDICAVVEDINKIQNNDLEKKRMIRNIFFSKNLYEFADDFVVRICKCKRLIQ
jgi:hypothetical protein